MPESPEIPQELPLADGAVWTAEIHTNKEEKKEETPVLDVHPAHHAASTWKEFFDHMLPVLGRHCEGPTRHAVIGTRGFATVIMIWILRRLLRRTGCRALG